MIRAVTFLCVFALTCTAKAACSLPAVAVLPFRQAGAPFVLTTSINGRDANLALTTGSDRTTINLASARHLGLDMHLSDRQTYGVGGTRKSYFTTVGRMRLGNIVADGAQLRGLDMWPDGAFSGLDGQLGMNFFGAYDLDLDTPGNTLVVYNWSGTCLSPTVALAPPLYSVPLADISRKRQIAVDVVIDGRHFRAALDSGALHTEMFRSAASRLGLDMEPLSAPGHPVEQRFGPIPVAYMDHVFATMQIGDLAFKNTTIRIVDQETTGIERHRTGSLLPIDRVSGGQEVILGADFMRKVHLWISNSSGNMIMQYPPRPSDLPK